MTQGVRDLIDAIITGDSVAIDNAFNAEMATRISDKIDDMRGTVAQGMFNEKVEQVQEQTEEQFEDQLVEDMLNEVLGKDDPAGKWISDFVHSDNPKFAGKSKEKRQQMALAAYYSKQKNEELDVADILDYLNENEEVLAELFKAATTE